MWTYAIFLDYLQSHPKNDCTNVKQNSLSHWLRFNSWNGTPVLFLIFWLVVFHRNKGSNFFQYWIEKSIIGQFSLSHSYTFIIVAIVPAVYYLFLTIWKSRHWHIGISIVTGIDSGIQIEKFYFYSQNFWKNRTFMFFLVLSYEIISTVLQILFSYSSIKRRFIGVLEKGCLNSRKHLFIGVLKKMTV